jgi:radical SAM protein with 4Fe4S-binding SPASM domain
MAIEPTTSCNLRCPQCPSGLRSFSRPTGMLQGDLYKAMIDEVHRSLVYLTLYFQGEPYLNTDFLEMVEYASKRNIYTATSTNAHFLDVENSERTVKSGLNRLVISIDGIEQDSYGKYRIGGKLDKVLKGTKNLMEAKKRLRSGSPYVIWQFIVFKHNEHELDRVKKLAKVYNVDELAIKTAQIYDYPGSENLLPENPDYSRYKVMNGIIGIKNNMPNHCWRMWSSCVITWDGKVVPCCFDKDATYRLGDIQNRNFSSIWKGKAYGEFRKLILKGRKHIEICKNCTEGTKVWA